jgi:hypothetical protein
VLLFSPFSATPLLSRALPTKASSIVFCSESGAGDKKSEGTGRGLAIATESCEMLFLATGGDKTQHSGPIRQLAGSVGEQSATVSALMRRRADISLQVFSHLILYISASFRY